jgi:hypothetical protein
MKYIITYKGHGPITWGGRNGEGLHLDCFSHLNLNKSEYQKAKSFYKNRQDIYCGNLMNMRMILKCCTHKIVKQYGAGTSNIQIEKYKILSEKDLI